MLAYIKIILFDIITSLNFKFTYFLWPDATWISVFWHTATSLSDCLLAVFSSARAISSTALGTLPKMEAGLQSFVLIQFLSKWLLFYIIVHKIRLQQT